MILDKCNEIINQIHKNQTAEKEEFDQQKELKKVCNPMIPKLFQSAGGKLGGMPGASLAMRFLHLMVPSPGPTNEEVDHRNLIHFLVFVPYKTLKDPNLHQIPWQF